MGEGDFTRVPPPFVGEGRHAIVEGLVSLFDRLSQSGPRWVSLEAPTGTGKTRIAHEFYARIAERQSEPHYWPDQIPQASDNGVSFGVGETQRKSSFPDLFLRPADAVPEWFWWGFSCGHRSGSEIQALTEDLGQLSVHADFLERSARKTKNLGERVAEAGKRHVKGGLEAGAGDLASVVAGWIPVLGLIQFASRKFAAYGAKSYRHARRSGASEVFHIEGGSDGLRLAEEIAQRIVVTTRSGFRFVLFVEDFQWADSQLTAMLLDVLRSKNAAVLVVTTAWSGELEDEDNPCSELLRLCPPDRLYRFSPLHPNPGEPFSSAANLSKLSSGDLELVLRHHLPSIDEATARRLVERYPNPNALAVLSTLKRVRLSVSPDGRVELSQADIDKMSPQLEDLYRESWAEMPEDVQIALSLAALVSPDEISSEWGFRDERWDANLLALAIEETIELSAVVSSQPSSMDQAAVRSGWALPIAETLRRFNEPAMRRLAKEYGVGDLSESAHIGPLRGSLGRLLSEMPEASSWELRLLFDRLRVALVASGYVGASSDAFGAAARLASASYVAGGESVELLRLATLAMAWTDEISTDDEDLRGLLLVKLKCEIRAGQPDAARATLDSLRASGFDVGSGLQLHFLEAMIEYSCGHDSMSLAMLETIFKHSDFSSESLLGAESLRLFALGLTRLYRLDEARAVLISPLFGEQDPERGSERRLLREKQIASVERRLGHLDVARELLERIGPEEASVLGEEHPDYPAALQLYGAVLRDSGRCHEALAIFERLYELRKSVLGDEHRDTLEAMSHVVWVHRHLGNLDEARGLGGRYLEFCRTVLGGDHRDTANALHVLGAINVYSGSFDLALELLNDSLSIRVSLEGANHWSSLMVQKVIARNRFLMGDREGAIADLIDIERRLRDFCFEPFECQLIAAEIVALQCRLGNVEVAQRAGFALSAVEARLGRNHPEYVRAVARVHRAATRVGMEVPIVDHLAEAKSAAGLDEDHIWRKLLAETDSTIGPYGLPD